MAQAQQATDAPEELSNGQATAIDDDCGSEPVSETDMRVALRLSEESARVFDKAVTVTVAKYTARLNLRFDGPISSTIVEDVLKDEPYEFDGFLGYGSGGTAINLLPVDE